MVMTMEKLYIVYKDNTTDVYLVKANNKKEAINIAYQTYIKPFQKDEKERGYRPYAKSDLSAKSTDELLGTDNIAMIT
jgi:hypothetical protein